MAPRSKRRRRIGIGVKWAIVPVTAAMLMAISAWSRPKLAPPVFVANPETTWSQKCDAPNVAEDVLGAANTMQTVRLAQLVAIRFSNPRFVRQLDNGVDCTGQLTFNSGVTQTVSYSFELRNSQSFVRAILAP